MKIARQLMLIAASAVAAIAAAVTPSSALTAGDAAPDFKAKSVLDGKVVEFSLKSALAKHAVVLYFFPKAFTEG